LPSRSPKLVTKAWTIHDQALNRKASPKIYSWHATEVACIGKGKAKAKAKAKAPYAFGCKATITTTNGSAPGGTFVLQADALHDNPYDGHTLGNVLTETANLTGVTPKRTDVDADMDRAIAATSKTRATLIPKHARMRTRTSVRPGACSWRAAKHANPI
jgi:IS5 family transposase